MQISIDTLVKILFFIAALMTSLFVMAMIFTPVIPFFLARILPDRAPLFILKAGGRIKVALGKLKSGMLSTKKDGNYRETPGSGYIFKKIMMFFAYDSYGATMPFDYVNVIQILKDRGYELNTFEDLQKLWDDPKTKEEIIGLGYGRTLKIKDMQYLWPANDNPFINEAKEATEIAIERKKAGRDYMQIVMIAFVICIVAYIAWSLFKNYGMSNAPVSVVCKFPEQIMNGFANNVAGNITI